MKQSTKYLIGVFCSMSSMPLPFFIPLLLTHFDIPMDKYGYIIVVGLALFTCSCAVLITGIKYLTSIQDEFLKKYELGVKNT